MLHWIETHVARTVLLALAAVVTFYELSALVIAYSADAYVTTDVVVVAPEVAGPIAELPVTENQRVEAGAPLLRIEPRPFAIALASAEAALDLARQQQAHAAEAVAEAEAAIAMQQARLTDAGAVLGREQTLLRDQYVALQRVDDARRDLTVAQAQLHQAEAQAVVARRLVQVRQAEVKSAEAALDRARYDLDRTRIAAPAAGRIAPFEARTGSYLAAGQPVLALVTDQGWRVVANMTERHLGRIAPGQTVWVMLGSDPWRIHVGRVRSLAGAVARSPMPSGVIPYVAPETDWVRLPRRVPVEIEIPGLAERIPAFRGGNARVLILL
jgi:multidrug efflux system membrane fusion protein